MSAVLVRRLIMRSPRPSTLRLQFGGKSDPQEVVIPKRAPHWTEIGETVDALGPELIELLDSEGKLMRAFKSEQFEDAALEEEDKPAKVNKHSAKLAYDAETERYRIFVGAIEGAYKHSTTVAFDKMMGLFEAMNDRAASGERSLENLYKTLKRAYEENAELAVNANGKEGGFDELIQTFLGSWISGQAAKKATDSKPANDKSNGKAKVDA